MEQKSVLVIGSANMDMVVVTDAFPQPGETVFGQQFAMFPGGKGANQAVCAAKLGGEIQFIGKMGSDLFHERLVRSMQNDGVRLDHLLVDPDAPTGIALITVDKAGENEIVVVSGSNMRLQPADLEAHKAAFMSAGVVLAQLEVPLDTVIRAATLARAAGALFILNPAPAQVLPAELFPLLDFLTPNRIELATLSGIPTGSSLEETRRAAERLLERGARNVIVTLGASGCLWVAPGSSQAFPAHAVKALDTTAAGDAFNGALALALCRGQDVATAIRFAGDVAAFSVTRMGAQSSMPSAAELEEWRQIQAGIR